MHLIPDWKSAHKKAVIVFCVVAGIVAQYYTDVLQFAFDQLPSIVQYMPESPGWGRWLPWVIIGLRIVSFKKKGE